MRSCLASSKTVQPRRVILIHGVSYPGHLGYREEIERLANETLINPKRKLSLVYLPTISRPFIDSTWTGLKGRAETLLELPQSQETANMENTIKTMLGLMVQCETHVVYVCGHPGTVDSVVATLSRRGFQIDRDIKHEKYYP